MAGNVKLHQYIGKVAQAIPASTYATDTAFSSDGANDVPIAGHKGVLFICDWTPVAAATATVALWYASDNIDSNAVTGSDFTGGSDAVFAAFSSDVSAGIFLLDYSLSKNNITSGTMYAKATIIGTPTLGVIGIPYGGNVILPSTNANTIVQA